MKKLTLIFCTLLIISCNSNGKKLIPGETEYQKELNESFFDVTKSPLKKKDLKNFKGLDFFPVDSTFIITAKLAKTENAPTFEMATTTDRKPLYKEYGILTFTVNGVDCTLPVYKSQDPVEDEKYKDYLFLPFTDDTSGIEAYGGGRYMDLYTTDEKPDGTIVLNFNNTYNPSCAYNEKFSCPLTPRKNHLDVAINAGIKVFNKH